ncbi:hypothetical protein D9611_000497 [Ephemerocybe angulata]|uniref:Minichromosome loss protein Mcl1 middle region domain-containing protein n=2 Tax=Ephemerocybe angulata TaxID=980116 RepID=A0A8H5F7U2_9AGAR|nr:hypothetical protein D9611_000497 [Tulosesus angulatus]
MSKIINTRPHGNGNTRLAFSKDGSRVFTGGADSLVRIWDVGQGADNEPDTAAEAEGPITWIEAAEDCWLSSSEDSEVRRYAKDSTSYEAPITSAAGVSVRCIAIDPQARKVAVASDELFVKVVDMEGITTPQKLEGYTSAIRALTWHPSGNLLTTCTQDGKIVIWDVSQSPAKREKVIEGIIPVVKDESSNEFQYDCSAVWHTSGEHFYVASKGHEIVTISRSNWSRVPGTFTDKNAVGAITALTLSPNGVYLLSASKSTVFAWSTQTKRVIASQAGTPGSIITQLAFCPKRNLVAWTDNEGGFTRWAEPISNTFPDPIKPGIGTKASASTTITRKPDTDLFGEDVLGKDDVMDDEANMAALDEDDDMLDIDKDWIVDDMDGALHDNEPVGGAGRSNAGFVKEMVSITKAQPPFQPGSTPFQNKKRYLAYNMLGVIEAIDQDVHQIINVVFFNQSSRSSFHFTDLFKNDLGYLGDCGAVFACPPEVNHPARVLFKPYSSAAQEWTYPLRPSTKVLGIAAGGLAPNSYNTNSTVDLQGYGNVVVATSEHDLTFLTGSGRERRILALPGDFVTMVAAPEWVFVVYRPGSTTIDGSQNLYYIVINFEDFSVRQRDVLPVPKGQTLKWVGLTEEGLPAMYDSTGYLSVLSKVRIPHHAAWVRISDTNLLERRQGKDETYWPVGISDSIFMCLILKGNQEYPGFPRPLIQELSITFPFRNADEREEKLERNLLYTQTLLDGLDDDLTSEAVQTREQALDKELILLIQGACKNGNVPRAIELVKLLHNVPSYTAAGQVADFYKLWVLKEKVEALKELREEEEDRLVVARNKRRRWLKPDKPLRMLASDGGANGGRRFDPLGDTRPPPPVERPSMNRVTRPVVEKTRFTSAAPPTQQQQASSSASTWGDDSLLTDSPPPVEKRKRDDLEEWPMSDSMPPPKTTKGNNPFARKAQEPNRNPFARSVEKQHSLHKSESFFDKVESAESGGNGTLSSKKRVPGFKGKEKAPDKKDAPKQTTLLNMMPKKPKAKPQATAADSQTDVETQATDDVAMSDLTLREDSQAETIPDSWEETQLVEEETQEA